MWGVGNRCRGGRACGRGGACWGGRGHAGRGGACGMRVRRIRAGPDRVLGTGLMSRHTKLAV